jgi:large subunit ribosomal protein L10
MATTKKKKSEILNEIDTHISKQKAVVILTTKGAKSTVTADKNFEFRSSVRKQGVILQVCKNTLVQKAFPTIDIKITGQTYLAYLESFDNNSHDEVQVPKTVVDSVKGEFEEFFIVLGSIVNGEFYNEEKTKVLSSVPSLDISLARIAGALNQITAKIAIAVKEIPTSIARGVQEAKK